MEYIQSFSAKNGYAPSKREIADHFEFKSLGTVQNYLVRLQRQGFLRKTWNGKRTTEINAGAVEKAMDSILTTTHRLKSSLQNSLILNDTRFQTETVSPPLSSVPSNVHTLPIMGKVAAGRPIEYSDQGEIDIPHSMIRKGKLDQSFVLKVKGDSMIGDGILDGDYVVIQKQSVAEQGETVVAMIGNEATIKRYYRKTFKGHPRIELHAANPAYEPILVDSLTETHGFKIEGVLVGVVRKL